ncbi:hypothetical protein Skr01_21620 [Sphaerisporangium krabiense]|uniref:Thiocillin family RiPP n=1 Tax=Sphaerisporangium krabiense TaxID=763782 RepID=A0A7W8Z5V1_9ACTN|nr:thiocillin family RiPP [Sphaerisporangium krabiense]MBB5627917.1 hypothetical protein [Sphaerisporangium krabiense]GII62077.1 hypothetical protein Skr01_21620 [Sphaerisporangium krabiense]
MSHHFDLYALDVELPVEPLPEAAALGVPISTLGTLGCPASTVGTWACR